MAHEESQDAVALTRKTSPPAPVSRRTYSTRRLADYLGVSPSKVLAWVRTGELIGLNVATTRSGRPRFRFDYNDVEAFLAARRSGLPSARAPPRRKPPRDVIEYF